MGYKAEWLAPLKSMGNVWVRRAELEEQRYAILQAFMVQRVDELLLGVEGEAKESFNKVSHLMV